MVAAKLQRWEDGWAPRYPTDPTRRCRSQSRRTGPGSVERRREEPRHMKDTWRTVRLQYRPPFCAEKQKKSRENV